MFQMFSQSSSTKKEKLGNRSIRHDRQDGSNKRRLANNSGGLCVRTKVQYDPRVDNPNH